MNSKKIAAILLIALVAGVYLITPVAAIEYGTISGTFKTGNTAPTIVSILPLPGNVDPRPDGVSDYWIQVQVRDTDGNADITKVELSLHDIADSGIEIDYQQVTSGFSIVDANTIQISLYLHFQYYNPPGQYAITATATDVAGSTGTQTFNSITYNSAIGLTINGPNALNFGSLTYGSASAAQTSTIHNSANTVIFVRGTAPDWASSAGGSAVSASTLTADGIAMNSGTSIVQLPLLGGGSTAQHQLSLIETVPSQTSGFTLSGTYTTTIRLTASSS
jgi:hypothetical protein